MEPRYPAGFSKCRDVAIEREPRSQAKPAIETGAGMADASELPECHSQKGHDQSQPPQVSTCGDTTQKRSVSRTTSAVDVELIIKRAVNAAMLKVTELLYQVTKPFAEMFTESPTTTPPKIQN